MGLAYLIKKPEYRAFLVSLAAHALLLLLVVLVADRSLGRTLEVSIVLENEPTHEIEPDEPEKEEIRPESNRRRRAGPKNSAHHAANATGGRSASRSENRTLSDPWSNYEREMFSRKAANADRGERQKAAGTSWGSEKTGRTTKQGESETVVVPRGDSTSATKWRKGSARRLISLPAIEYPESVRKKSGQGVVELLIEVDERGHVENVEIVKSSGITRLDLNARNAYRRAVFSPSASGENATGVVVVTFRMRDN